METGSILDDVGDATVDTETEKALHNENALSRGQGGGGKRLMLGGKLGGKLWGSVDGGSSDQNGGADAKRNPLRQSFSGKMQGLLLHLKGGGGGGAAEGGQPPSPSFFRSPMRSRSFEAMREHAEIDAALRASAPETPPRDKAAAAAAEAARGAGAGDKGTLGAPATGGKPGKSLWGKLGSGIKPKARKASPATVAALHSLDGPSVELPLPSNGSASASAGALCPSEGRAADGASYDARADADADDGPDARGPEGGSCGGSPESASPGRALFDAGPSPYLTRGGYYDETLNLQQALHGGFTPGGACATPQGRPDGLEAMPDYLLTPGMQGILEANGAADMLPTPPNIGAGMGPPAPAAAPPAMVPQPPPQPRARPQAPPRAVAAAAAAYAGAPAAAAAAAAAYDADATIALLPAADLARAGYPMDSTMALFPQPAAAHAAGGGAAASPGVAGLRSPSVAEDVAVLCGRRRSSAGGIGSGPLGSPLPATSPVAAAAEQPAAAAAATAAASPQPEAGAEQAAAVTAPQQGVPEAEAANERGQQQEEQQEAVDAERLDVGGDLLELTDEPLIASGAAGGDADASACQPAPPSPRRPSLGGGTPAGAAAVRESIPLFVSALPAQASAGGVQEQGRDDDEKEPQEVAKDEPLDAHVVAAAPQGGTRGAGGGAGSRLLGGGAQRVQAAAGAAAADAGGLEGALATVEEAAQASPASAKPEASPAAAATPEAAAAAPSPGASPLRPRRLSGSPASPARPPSAAEAPRSPTPVSPPPQPEPTLGAPATPQSTPRLAAATGGAEGEGPACAATPAPTLTPTMTAAAGGAGATPGTPASFFTPDVAAGPRSADAAAAKAAAIEAAIAEARGGASAFGSPASGVADSPADFRSPGARLSAGSPTLALYEGVADLRTLSDTTLLAPPRAAAGRAGGPAPRNGAPAPGAAAGAPAAAAAAAAGPLGGLSTPTVNLLDRSAVSPSAVYHVRLAGTPYQQAAALNVDAARHAPLIDSSPFDLDAMDTMVFREDLDKVCLKLSADSPAPAAKPAAAPPAAPAAAAPAAGDGAAVGDALLAAQLRVMTQKAAGFERQLRQAQVEGEQLKEQLATLEFEKTELGQQDEFEREARLFAEDQLKTAQREAAALRQQVAAHQEALAEAKCELQLLQERQRGAEEGWAREREELRARAAQAASERDEALDRLNFQDMKLTALGGANSELQAALAAEQARVEAAGAQLAAKDQELARAAQELAESQAQTEKAVEQVCSANMAAEQAAARSESDSSRLADALAAASAAQQQTAALAAERDKLAGQAQHYALLKQKYAQKSAALKEALAKVAAKEAENGELMAMCDQLLQQQEAARRGDTAEAHDQR